MWMSILMAAALAAGTPAVQPGNACLHAAGQERPADRDRSIAAVAAVRAINTAQSQYAARQAQSGASTRKYATRNELQSLVDGTRYNLSPGVELTPGFKLTLDVFESGYWFELVDTRDACGFRFVSNQSGLILTAQPIQ